MSAGSDNSTAKVTFEMQALLLEIGIMNLLVSDVLHKWAVLKEGWGQGGIVTP